MIKYVFAFAIAGFIFSCNNNNVKIDNSLKKYFDETRTNGCFALMDNGTGKFTVYNLPRYRDSSFSPASTFKIINALIGLQTGVISSDSMVIKWDGIQRWNSAWNKDLTMYEAFRASSVPYFQEVARRIGRDTMQQWLDSLHYGNTKIKTRIDEFWLDNSLTITPDEQLGLVKRLYFNQLPFFKVNQEVVKNAMLQESNTAYKLGYKTGSTGWNNVTNSQTRWIVGWIEENNHPYFFVLNLSSADKNFGMDNQHKTMLKSILTDLGFFKGKM